MRRTMGLLVAMSVCVGLCLLLCTENQAADKPKAPAKTPNPVISPATHPAQVTAPAEPADMASMFNGKDLTEWNGDPRLWSVKDGMIHGETTKENVAKGNTFCIWKGGEVGDFELRFSYRLQGGNSGMQYRSKHLDPNKASNGWVVGGYQAEIANGPGRDGFIYDEKGKRGRMCMPGEKVTWTNEGKKITGQIDDVNSIAAALKVGDWNDYVIIAKGNNIRHWINGVQTIDFTDESDSVFKSGIIAIQIHAGGPMVIEIKNPRIKKYDAPAAEKK